MSLDALWAWWTANRDHVVALATLIGGPIALVLLYIRTRAADRTARAALDQAEVAAAQAKTAANRHDEQTKADRERRITESFAKAVEQLGNDKQLATRLGGIYLLERISREKENEHKFYWPIMETLTAFVRERAPWPPRQANPFAELHGGSAGETASEPTPGEELKSATEIRPATDIQAILTVLGRRDKEARNQDKVEKRRLNLKNTDLRGAHLWNAHLERVDFSGAHLEGARLWEAHLEEAILLKAHLEGADLSQADLQRTALGKAHLRGAELHGARLEGAFLGEADLNSAALTGAHLEGANVIGANLRRALLIVARLSGACLHRADLAEAVGLTQEQLESAAGDTDTILPPGLTRPTHWPEAFVLPEPGI